MPPNSDKSHNILTSGIKYPKHRDVTNKNPYLWLKDKRNDDGAEGLWRIHDKLYDLEEFILMHPGGPDWIKFTKGTDITEAFESHHISSAPHAVLPRYYIRDARKPRNYPFTFNENGFYRTLKQNVSDALKELPKKKISQNSNHLIDGLCILTFLLSCAANYFWSYTLSVVAAYCLTCTTIAAHNFFHRADNFRMYFFDLSLLSSREWRISHALSHHLYPNSVTDLEISMFEPMVDYLPKSKSFLKKYGSWLISPILWMGLYPTSAIKRYMRYFRCGFAHFTIREIIPYTIPLTMYMTTGEILSTLTMWMIIILIASFHFGMVGLNAAHHHPDIYHDGDAARNENDKDWGLYQLDCVMDRHEINGNYFLVLTNFGEHGLHHLFPTLDHAVLEKLWPVFEKTMNQFNIKLRINSQLELVKGQFQQLARDIPNKIANYSNLK